MKKFKILIILLAIVSTLSFTNVYAVSASSKTYQNCIAKCDKFKNKNGKIKKNKTKAYDACMAPCNNKLDKTEANKTVENLNKNKNNSSKTSTTTDLDFCKSTASVWQIVGWVFMIVKIVLPILLIIFGVMDFSKAVMASKDDEIKKAANSLGIRAIAAVAVFFVPTLVGIVMGLIVDFANSGAKADYDICKTCILSPSSCDTSNDVGKQ